MTYAAFLEELRAEFPKVRIVEKTGWFWSLLALVAPNFVYGFTTTVRNTIFVSPAWNDSSVYTPAERVAILKHERVHLRQARRYTWPLFAFLYLFIAFPIGLSYFRYRFEREAYLEDIRTGWNTVENVVQTLGGPLYLWCWPKSWVRKWFEENL